jgi:hypothetical protein
MDVTMDMTIDMTMMHAEIAVKSFFMMISPLVDCNRLLQSLIAIAD